MTTSPGLPGTPSPLTHLRVLAPPTGTKLEAVLLGARPHEHTHLLLHPAGQPVRLRGEDGEASPDKQFTPGTTTLPGRWTPVIPAGVGDALLTRLDPEASALVNRHLHFWSNTLSRSVIGDSPNSLPHTERLRHLLTPQVMAGPLAPVHFMVTAAPGRVTLRGYYQPGSAAQFLIEDTLSAEDLRVLQEPWTQVTDLDLAATGPTGKRLRVGNVFSVSTLSEERNGFWWDLSRGRTLLINAPRTPGRQHLATATLSVDAQIKQGRLILNAVAWHSGAPKPLKDEEGTPLCATNRLPEALTSRFHLTRLAPDKAQVTLGERTLTLPPDGRPLDVTLQVPEHRGEGTAEEGERAPLHTLSFWLRLAGHEDPGEGNRGELVASLFPEAALLHSAPDAPRCDWSRAELMGEAPRPAEQHAPALARPVRYAFSRLPVTAASGEILTARRHPRLPDVLNVRLGDAEVNVQIKAVHGIFTAEIPVPGGRHSTRHLVSADALRGPWTLMPSLITARQPARVDALLEGGGLTEAALAAQEAALTPRLDAAITWTPGAFRTLEVRVGEETCTLQDGGLLARRAPGRQDPPGLLYLLTDTITDDARPGPQVIVPVTPGGLHPDAFLTLNRGGLNLHVAGLPAQVDPAAVAAAWEALRLDTAAPAGRDALGRALDTLSSRPLSTSTRQDLLSALSGEEREEALMAHALLRRAWPLLWQMPLDDRPQETFTEMSDGTSLHFTAPDDRGDVQVTAALHPRAGDTGALRVTFRPGIRGSETLTEAAPTPERPLSGHPHLPGGLDSGALNAWCAGHWTQDRAAVRDLLTRVFGLYPVTVTRPPSSEGQDPAVICLEIT